MQNNWDLYDNNVIIYVNTRRKHNNDITFKPVIQCVFDLEQLSIINWIKHVRNAKIEIVNYYKMAIKRTDGGCQQSVGVFGEY